MVIHIYLNLGNISNIELCQELKTLANSRLSETLFIFDDIWKKDHYKYLSFAKKSISTSRFKYLENELDHHCIRLPEKLTYDEAIELLALLAVNDNDQTLRQNPVVKNVIDSCQGLPLAITLIGGLDLKTDEEWNKAKDIIAKKSADIELAHYGFNLYGTLQLSVDTLNDEIRPLFEQLAVFKRVGIPIQSVASLWNYDEIEARNLVKKMHNKSLLTYDKENTCMSNKLSYICFMLILHEWIVYDLDKNEEISFAQNDQGEDVKTDFDSVQFCPAQSQTHVIMTLSGDLCEVRIWKIEGNCITPTNKQISCQYDIEYCRWVLMQDSVCVLLWWRKYQSEGGEYKNYEPDDPENWINECQIEMWNAQERTCRSFKVPAFIHAKDDGRYFATNDFQHGLPLRFRSKSTTIGLLKMEQAIEFENQFRPIHVGNVKNILISGDQSMIAIDCSYKKLILKMSGDQVQSRARVDQSGRSMFIPGSNRLLIYGLHNVYEYSLQGDKIAWQDISQTKSVDVGRPQRNPQTTVNIFDLIEFVGIEDCRKYRELINGILEEESTAKDLIRFRYRKKDNTLILFPIFSSKARWIITVNLTTGKKSVNRLTLSHGARVVYVDDDYLYVWERNKDDRRSLKCYKFGDGEYQLLQNIDYQGEEGLICKIMMNYNPHKIEHSPLRMKKEKLVDVWGEKDAEMIANAMGYVDLLLLLENGDHIAILNENGHLRMKRYKDNIKYFDSLAQFFNHENLWSDKQLILYEKYSSLNIYNPQTLQLQITLPFPHFRIWDMQWNLQHSQLIIRSRKDYIRSDQDYCLVTHVKKT
ncbi:uncharacterized protein TRIADDRAFT_62368 [Trichoplax adhaerens]|uniref:Uncharacterized protein n=1 Tax=Trichoplax adhaerens TaxID=10228 RepID=B3SDK9_TRIAD|nr:hypothetical protein TRIADDRAFT_62368 [Trichoplax adhaerens]EDV19208.1 hypothetical protein TRIADDRAFT_62368 [Trichoplax adhaerens]|eukprot:XP_002118328.1 hypothetical protein TRIADDRAFT_62368 [Trichoplax adhaerens]